VTRPYGLQGWFTGGNKSLVDLLILPRQTKIFLKLQLLNVVNNGDLLTVSNNQVD